jgi:hypothetical protein
VDGLDVEFEFRAAVAKHFDFHISVFWD